MRGAGRRPGRGDPQAGLSTFSLAACDPKAKAVGVAVASKFVAAGAVVPFVRAGVGAVASQAWANPSYGPRGLNLLARGRSPRDVALRLGARDSMLERRQVGIVDARGRAAAFTGAQCLAWAGHTTGRNFSAQGNILVSELVVEALADAFANTEGDLPARMIAALHAGQRAGGDQRGQQAAALLIEKPHGGYGKLSNKWVDVRVDDHARPIEELERVFEIYSLCLLERDDPADVVPLEGRPLRVVQDVLARQGYLAGKPTGAADAATLAALEKWFSVNNFEDKWRKDGKVWGSIYRYMLKVGGG